MRIGFDNDKYIQMQSQKILERIARFGDKLYLEFGGKLFDDYHASRVVPGFKPDTKIKMLLDVLPHLTLIFSNPCSKREHEGEKGQFDISC